MSQIEIKLPKMGESVTEATITNWLKNIGDTVEMDEPLVEVATDKVDNELPSEVKGVLVKQMVEENQVAQVGDIIAIISTGSEADPVASPPEKQPEVMADKIEEKVLEVVESIHSNQNGTADSIGKISPSGKFFSPLVRSIAEKEGVQITELEALQGSGKAGRVTKKDILSYIESGKKGASSVTEERTLPQTKAVIGNSNGNDFFTSIKSPTVNVGPNDEIIEMDRMRKLIAEHMVMSTHVSPHVTSYVEADVTKIVNWRNKIKKEFSDREGEKITYTPIFIEAIVKAIKDFPMINVSVSGTNIIKRNNINIGLATALPSGNLIVPVIKNADRMSLTGLVKSVNELANNARNNALKPEDIQDGTYTVTNVGTFGNVMGTPIINQPQAAILALGAIRKLPSVIETPDGDFIGIRHKMFLSHSYDHRIVDGALGGQFVRRVADYLEQFDENREP